MGIDWSKITNNQIYHFRSRSLPLIEADIAGWHYWAFYCPVSTDYNQLNRVHQIEGVFFAREALAKSLGDEALNQAFHVPGAWLKSANGVVYQILHERILSVS